MIRRVVITSTLLVLTVTACHGTKVEDSVYYKNCAEVRAASAAPLHKGSEGYRIELDRDGDGVACDG